VEKISDKKLEEQLNMMFCVKIGKSANETLALLTLASGEYAMKKLSEEGQDVQDDQRSGQPKTQGQMHMRTEHEPWCA
jgi:hypothetical protein